jgi:hypothetical protein
LPAAGVVEDEAKPHYGEVIDAERLSQDPTFRLVGSEKIRDSGAALTSRLQSFETEMLAEEDRALAIDESSAAVGEGRWASE